MHWIDRGPEPEGLQAIRARYTPRWVDFYRHNVGTKPWDSYWTRFYEDLRHVFGGLCAYCERKLKGEVDHFRPKTAFPQLVYFWSNWLFACHECNSAKSSCWPPDGYVDPCATSQIERPEHYFMFKPPLWHIAPKAELSPRMQQKAQKMIDDLRLNEWQHLEVRVERIEMISSLLPDDLDNLTDDEQAELEHFSSYEVQLSGVVRSWLYERGYPIGDVSMQIGVE